MTQNNMDLFNERLFEAVSNDRVNHTAAVITAGAKINIVNDQGSTPLHLTKNPDVAKLLIEAGANINFKDKHGGTPLHYAVLNGNLELAKLLISAGANPNARDGQGNTPLHLVKSKENGEFAELLMLAGARIDIKNRDGKTAMQTACQDIQATMRQVAATSDYKALSPPPLSFLKRFFSHGNDQLLYHSLIDPFSGNFIVLSEKKSASHSPIVVDSDNTDKDHTESQGQAYEGYGFLDPEERAAIFNGETTPEEVKEIIAKTGGNKFQKLLDRTELKHSRNIIER